MVWVRGQKLGAKEKARLFPGLAKELLEVQEYFVRGRQCFENKLVCLSMAAQRSKPSGTSVQVLPGTGRSARLKVPRGAAEHELRLRQHGIRFTCSNHVRWFWLRAQGRQPASHQHGI